MFPHQNNIRERRVGQPPMAPQHLMGMPQQGPGVIMSMTTQQVQIMTQNHYPNQNSYSTQGQSNVSQYVTPQQIPPQKSNYHQTGYSHNNPQIILTQQTINRNKNYRKEYNIVKDPVNYNLNNQNNQQNNFTSNESNSYSGYHQGNYNGHYQKQDGIPKSNGSHEAPSTLKENDEATKDSSSKNSENKRENSTMPQSVVAGAKEKTPMCLVNELARFNKITHQYRLTNEKGPAHKKSFTVTLTLGTEEYTAKGPSIKKAQHSAAAEALSKTAYSHPLPKANKNMHSGKSNVTPTVELNALAMKRGEPAIYKFLEPTPAPHIFQPPPSSYAFRRPYGIHREFSKRGRSNIFSRGGRVLMKNPYAQNMHYTVSLKVGSWEFFGEGMSPQSARHDAASKALTQLKMLPLPKENSCSVQKDSVLNPDQEYDSTLKSPISLVHEIALKRNMNVLFEVISDRGPSHMKIFVTKCTVGELTAMGEGNGKKVSKKRAAENMLIELKKLPPLSPSFAMGSMSLSRLKRKFQQTKKKSRNLIKIVQENKNEPEYGEEINPISRLIQIQQLKKEKEPVYTLLEENGTPRKREFLIEVSIGQLKATGSGPNKKLAKKAAAQNLLTQMGYGKPENSTKPALKLQESTQDSGKDRKVTFVEAEKSPENNTGGSAGRQLKPGIYVMSCDQHVSSTNNHSTSVNMQTTATIAKELLKGGNSPTADALVQKSRITKSTTPQTGGAHSFRPKDQLLYLADLLNFQVHFSDFPKGNHSEFLSLVTMSTDPSHVCHGSGSSIEESQDQAALTALRALSEMGLDSVTAQNPSKELSTGRREL